MPEPPPAAPALGRVLLALIGGQIGLHATLAGLRMAAPLDALAGGASAWAVGLLLALFAVAPVALALPAGRMADRHGLHRPLRLAVALTVLGAVLAVLSTALSGPARFALLGLGAVGTGAGAHMGLIAVQRTGTVLARDAVERMRVFSWIAVAPSLANVIGPVLAGVMIDHAGFRLAYAAFVLVPFVGLWTARQVPSLPRPTAAGPPRPAWDLLREPGLPRLLFVNWLLSTCWDVHGFAVPILGHRFGFSATTIGLVLGTFTLAVTLVRLVIAAVAERVREEPMLRGAMLATAVVFVAYPWARSPLAMAACAALLGLALGMVQPMVMSTLHRLTPPDRHGEALALRSMAINASSAAMPLVFGAAGAWLGAASMFWIVGAAVGAGAGLVRRLYAGPAPHAPD